MCERRYLSPGPRSAAAAPLDHISQQDGHNRVTSLIVAFITVIALSNRVKGVNRQKPECEGGGRRDKESFSYVIRSHLYVILHVETFINFASHTGGNATVHRYRSTERMGRDKPRVRLAMLLIDRARSMYICVQLYVRYKHMYITTGEKEDRMLLGRKFGKIRKRLL